MHWCDSATARWFTFLGRRLEGFPVLLAATAWDTRRDPLLETLRSISTIVAPGPLQDDGCRALLARELGRVSPELSTACRRVTGGNPFLLIELGRELAALGVTAGSAVELVEELGPDAVSRSIAARLAGLPPTTRELAAASSVLGDGSRLRDAAAVAAVTLDAATAAADRLVAASVLEDADPIRFAHPIVRNAVYEGIPAGERSRLHMRAASVLPDECLHVEQRAAHYLRAMPAGSPAAVADLTTAARVALARAAPRMAATHLRRALAEPPTASQRAAILLELGRAELLSGDPCALEHLELAVAESSTSLQRIEGARALATTLTLLGRPEQAVDRLRAALADPGLTDIDQRMVLTAELALVARVDPTGALPAADRRRLLAELLPEPGTAGATRAERLVLANLAVEATMSCEPAATCAALAERAMSGTMLLDEETSDSPVFAVGVCALVFADRFDRAAELLS
ncbi:MAG TPA: hypothetical protein VJ814_00240, partial [Gaiellaceae bacterium]|nr:hypothetical protein [Gaiellaceae bacterium]